MTNDQPSTEPATILHEALLVTLMYRGDDDTCGHLAEALRESLLVQDRDHAALIALGILTHCELTCTVLKSGSRVRAARSETTS